MIYLFIINIGLIGYLFFKEYKTSKTIREILASKFGQETFQEVIAPPPEEETPQPPQEPLLDEVEPEEILKQ